MTAVRRDAVRGLPCATRDMARLRIAGEALLSLRIRFKSLCKSTLRKGLRCEESELTGCALLWGLGLTATRPARRSSRTHRAT